MKVTLSTDAVITVRADLLAIGVSGSPSRNPHVAAVDKAVKGALKKLISLESFEGKPGQVLKVTPSGIGAAQLVLIGLPEGDLTEASARQVAATAGQLAKNYGALAIAPFESESADVLQGAASGALLGAYRYTRYLTGDRAPTRSLSSVKLLVGKRTSEGSKAVNAGVALAESVNHARDLVNAPPNDLNPPALADFAAAQAKALGISCKVWDKRGIEKLGMHLLLAVNRGSGVEPRFIHMTYKPKTKKPAAKVVFVGKGLTFDAGGLCLKPAKSMLDMKCDMAGAATTLGVIMAAARLELPVEVHAIIGSTENMLGEDAYRPGDVFPSLEGKTVEIINTDAEGRLVLADALAYASKLGADYLIDHATLTGACMVALGPWTAGLFTANEQLSERYAAAARRAGEEFWRLPLNPDLKESLKSDIADLKHTGDRNGGAITAALFLSEFVGDATWMHLDIAGPAFLDRPHGVSEKGGSGFGVMTGVEFLRSLVP